MADVRRERTGVGHGAAGASRAFQATVALWLLATVVMAGDARPDVSAFHGADDQPALKLLSYRFERSDANFADMVDFPGGASLLGKAVEWGDLVLLYRADGRADVFRADDVDAIRLRRFRRHLEKPSKADLTIAYIERLPRDSSFHGHVTLADGLPRLDIDLAKIVSYPAPGSDVTFRIHVRNAGFAASAPCKWRALVDGKEIATGDLAEVAAGAEQVVEARWKWDGAGGMLRVELDPANATSDWLKWNNVREESLTAQTVAVVVDKTYYERFRQYPNMLDSFCFEDWLAAQLGSLNALFADSVHPSSPQGILERVRCDRILVVEEPDAPRHRDAWMPTLRQGGKSDSLAEYGALVVLDDTGDDRWDMYHPLKINWGLLGDIAGQMGLVDWTVTDTRLDQCLAVNRFERYVQRQHFFPYPNTFMYQYGPYRFSEVCAGYLNRMVGKPRGVSGEFLYDVPETISLDVRACNGAPLEGVRVDVYQLQAGGELKGYIAGAGPRDPLYSSVTGPDGRVDLLNQDAPSHQSPGGYALRANAFGRIATDGSNGLLLLKIQSGDAEEYHFLRLFDANVAFLRGNKQQWTIEVRTNFGVPDGPKSVLTIPILMDDRKSKAPPMQATWTMPPIPDPTSIEEFRVYKRTGFGGDNDYPNTLVGTLRRIHRRWSLVHEGTYFDPKHVLNDRYSRDTFYTVAPVDRQGRQGSLAPPGYLAHDKYPRKFAIDVDCAFITLGGPGPMQMLRWDGDIGTHPFGPRTLMAPGYRPDFAGIAVTADHQLVVTDPTNHVLALYDLRGDLQQIIPQRAYWPGFSSDKPGEFFEPVDVAVDGDGRMYVADRGNNRVQILDAQGHPLSNLDEGFRFDAPHAVAYSNGHIAVTDHAGRRVRLYDIREGQARLVRELTDLVEADRAIVSRSGRLYVTGFNPISEEYGLMIWAKDNDVQPVETRTSVDMGLVHEPRGLYLYTNTLDQDYAYFVNIFPFDVRRLFME